MTQDELESMLEELLDKQQNIIPQFSQCDSDYIDSCINQYDELGTLSDKQIEVLQRIYKER